MTRSAAGVIAAAVLALPPAVYAQAGGGTPAGGGAAVAGALTVAGDPAGQVDPVVSIGILAGRPAVTAARAAEPPRIDGRLDDPIWRGAARLNRFVQQRPAEGAPATEETEVFIAYDPQTLYIAVHAHYSDRRLIRANRVDRDQSAGDDMVRMYFDPFLDQQRAYVFAVNAYGVQNDAVLNSGETIAGTFGELAPGGLRGGTAVSNYGGQSVPVLGAGKGFWDRLRRRMAPQNHTSGARRSGAPGDSSWDALFASAGRMVDDGWTAEVAIPFKSLRYPARQPGEAHRWGFQIERTIDSKDESVVWAPVSRNVMGMLRQMGVLEGMTGLSTSRNLEFLPTATAIHSEVLHSDGDGHDHGPAGTQSEGALNVKYGITSNLVFDFTYNPDFSQIESDRAQIEVNQRFPVFYPELRPFFLEGQEIYQVSAPPPLSLVHTRTLVDPRYGAKLTGKIGNTAVGFMVANDEAAGHVDDPQALAYGQAAKVVFGRVRYDLYSESHIGAIVTDREFLDGYSRVGGVDGVFRLGVNHRFRFTAVNADRRNAAGARATGSLVDLNFRKEGRHLIYEVEHNEIHPEFGTDLGFVRRADQKQSTASVSYRWWPESWLINWEPRLQYERNYDFAGVLQDESMWGRLNFQFANNVGIYATLNRDMERYRQIDFWKTRYNLGWSVNTSRRFGTNGSFWRGDQIRFIEDPFLGADQQLNLLVNVRPFSRLQSEVGLNTSRFTDVRTDAKVFDVKILRTRTTYQFTNRLLVRNIVEYNSFDRTLGGNVLVTYRVNAGTVFFVGYDDHYRQGSRIDETLYPTTSMLRTNRAIFTKVQYLFRY
ncbi:MAG: carbohydrate binding family 9 domain-containing protein [Acidobacteria bacterium]|nr:carbohydrate binding family 9 domain-containing protein [Acidobacteriota bacterium]